MSEILEDEPAMKYFYLDTTALVKHYHLELGSRMVDEIIHHARHAVVLGEPTIIDLYALLNRRVETGEITRDDYFTSVVTFEAEMTQGRFQFLNVDADTLKNIRLLILQHNRLGVQQGLHLALSVEMLALKPTVVSTDPILLSACEAEGLKVLNPEQELS
jgi:predicted nucleic acid-binding protein